jgi:hypothetical protein
VDPADEAGGFFSCPGGAIRKNRMLASERRDSLPAYGCLAISALAAASARAASLRALALGFSV